VRWGSARIPALTITEFRGATFRGKSRKVRGINSPESWERADVPAAGEIPAANASKLRDTGPRSSNEIIEESRAFSDDALVYSAVSPVAAPSRGGSGAECPALIIRRFPRTFIPRRPVGADLLIALDRYPAINSSITHLRQDASFFNAAIMISGMKQRISGIGQREEARIRERKMEREGRLKFLPKIKQSYRVNLL